MKTSLFPFVLPPLGAQAGGKARVLRWTVQAGHPVAKDAEIVEVEADKCAFGVECPWDGTLESIDAEEGCEIGEGSRLGMIRAKAAS